jgi:hypothetical protein
MSSSAYSPLHFGSYTPWSLLYLPARDMIRMQKVHIWGK